MKKALIISVAINCLLIFVFAAKRFYYSSGQGEIKLEPMALNELSNMNRVDLFDSLPIREDDIVFVGNSLTEGFPITELFGPNFKNRGIRGNTTLDVLRRIESIAIKKPRKIFLEIGINDLKNGVPIDSTYRNYISIVEKIRALSTITQIIIQSLTPTSGYYLSTNAEVVIINKMLYNYCKKNDLIYIDLFTPLQSGNGLDNTFTNDGLHLNYSGYKIWQEKIENYLNFSKTHSRPHGAKPVTAP